MAAGAFVFIEGDDEVKAFLNAGPSILGQWLQGIINDTSDFAGGALRLHAPGHISELVGEDHSQGSVLAEMTAVAGVMPAIDESTLSRGLNSDPADYPVFVDQGTGIYGEKGSRIYPIPGHVMAFMHGGEKVYATSIAGQRAQHFSRSAFEDTVGWLPGKIELAKSEIPKAT